MGYKGNALGLKALFQLAMTSSNKWGCCEEDELGNESEEKDVDPSPQ